MVHIDVKISRGNQIQDISCLGELRTLGNLNKLIIELGYSLFK